MKKLILGTCIYVVTIFPITALWHVALFQGLYVDFGYFKHEETLLAGIAGFLNICVQGVILALLFSSTRFKGADIVKGLKFSGLIFVFYFTVQVINFIVRKEINNVPFFVLMEATYMLVQFTLYGVLMGIFVKAPKE